MSKLPQVSGQECVGALKRLGFSVIRQRGSHIIMRREDPFAQLVVPDHKQLDRGTLRSILREADLTVEVFISVL
jgi:predicted RNA binding protein YcfA (HicA-like mRNA interferase family)